MRIAIIGSGNMGTQLSHGLKAIGVNCQIYVRIPKDTSHYAIDSLSTQAYDVIVLAVNDSSISNVAEQLSLLNLSDTCIIHTSGATPLSTLTDLGLPHCGVLWPPQSIRKDHDLDWSQVPVCIESSTEVSKAMVSKLAHMLSTKVFEINTGQRLKLHLGAVLVNNFTNHLFVKAHELMQEEGLPYELLLPIINETFQKLNQDPPILQQTGPAIRHDQVTIDRHLAAIKADTALTAVYAAITTSIQHYNA